MRAAEAIRKALGEVVNQLTMVAEVAEKRAQVRHDDTLAAVGKVQPVAVDLDQALADRIVEKIHGPLTIPQGMSDWIREEAKFHDVQTMSRLGYSSTAGDIRIDLKTNGTMTIEVRDVFGARWWAGTFVPPDFGKEQR